MTKASDNIFPQVILDAVTSDPTTPSNDNWKLFARVNGPYAKSSNSTVGPLGVFRGAKVYNNTTQTMNGSGTNSGNTILTFNSEEFDTDNFHSTAALTSRLTIPAGAGGYYRVGCLVYGQPPATATLIDVLVDGVKTVKHGVRNMWGSAPTASLTFNGSWLFNLTAGQYLEIQLNNPNASTFTVGHATAVEVQTSFWCEFLGV